MNKKSIAIMLSCIILVFSFIVTAAADKPDKNGTASLMANLTQGEQQKLVEVAFAELDLTVLRLNPQTTAYIMAIYSVENTSGYCYYHLLLGANSRSVTVDTMEGTRITKFHINSKSTVYHYVWSDTATGGWVYAYAETDLEFPCSSVLFYRTIAGTNGVDHNMTNMVSNLLVGQGVLNECAQSWIDAYNVKVNGQQGQYTQEELDAYVATARQAGRNDVINAPNDYGLYTSEQRQEYGSQMYQTGIAYVTANPSTAGLYSAEQYNRARQDGYAEGYAVGYEAGGGGQTTVIERPSIQLDVQDLVFSIPALFNQIIQGAFGFTIFGINIAGALLSIIVIVAFIWLIKKFK